MTIATSSSKNAATASEITVWKQTLSGRPFPLVPGFGPEDIDLFHDMPETLARLCRYGGAVPGNPFSVAQHCVLMADAALEETGDVGLAAHCLLHDGHEYVFGDLTTPVAHWLEALAVQMFGRTQTGIIPDLIAQAKHQLDLAIWKAAGLTPPGASWREKIREYDVRMLATEKRHLLMPAPWSWGVAVETAMSIRMRGKICAWPVARAADEFRDRLITLCPNAMRI